MPYKSEDFLASLKSLLLALILFSNISDDVKPDFHIVVTVTDSVADLVADSFVLYGNTLPRRRCNVPHVIQQDGYRCKCNQRETNGRKFNKTFNN